MVHGPGDPVTRRELLRRGAGLGAFMLAGGLGIGCGAAAPGRKGPSRVGFLAGAVAGGPARPAFADIMSELGKLGYTEGQNISFESRFPTDPAEVDFAAAELGHLNLDANIAYGDAAALALSKNTSGPIIMASSQDPVSNGLIDTLARPGRNVTGVTAMVPELGAKWLELLKAIVPNLSRVAAVYNSSNPAMTTLWKVTEPAARSLGQELNVHPAPMPTGMQGAVNAVAIDKAEAIVVLWDPGIGGQADQLVQYAIRNRIPTISQLRQFVAAGGLLSYGFDLAQLAASTAAYVDKVLKGAKPADLPVEQPSKFDLVINSKTASAMSLTIPQSLLAQATEVIQ